MLYCCCTIFNFSLKFVMRIIFIVGHCLLLHLSRSLQRVLLVMASPFKRMVLCLYWLCLSSMQDVTSAWSQTARAKPELLLFSLFFVRPAVQKRYALNVVIHAKQIMQVFMHIQYMNTPMHCSSISVYISAQL